MNAIVEVATAEIVAQANIVRVEWTRTVAAKVDHPVVAASTKRVLSIAGTSISAVSPDHNFLGGTALAAA